MPRDTRALTRAARTRAKRQRIPYQEARDDVVEIRSLVEGEGLSWGEAEQLYDSPVLVSLELYEDEDDDPESLIWCRECGAGAGPYDVCECGRR